MFLQAVCSCVFDLDPMTLVYKLDVDIVQMYMHTTSKLSK